VYTVIRVLAPLLDMTNLKAFKVGDTVMYSVYNSRGHLSLYTSSYRLARTTAEGFARNTGHLVVVVREANSSGKKR
jgi:hypothetical protein